MSRWEPWNNVTKDRREARSEAQHDAANKAAHATIPARGEMPAVVKAATGSGDWPWSAPLVPHNDTQKVQE